MRWADVLGVLFVLGALGVGTGSLASALLPAGSPLSAALLVLDARVLLGAATVVLAGGLALYLRSVWGGDPARRVESGPAVEALVPVYRDAAVLDRAVEALVASTYEDLSVTVIAEPDDDAAIDRARELAADHAAVSWLVNEDRQGSKAGALNAAIERSDADVIGMFDADQEPHPELVSSAVAALGECDAVRVRSLPRPGGLIESVAYYEYLLLLFLPQQLASALFGFGMIGTRSALVERSVFETVGLFDEAALTEDMEFTHRCHRADLRIGELDHCPCFEEPAHTLGDWWWQRVRWMRGHAQVGHRQLRSPSGGLDADALGSLLTLGGTFAGGVLLATTAPKLLIAGLSHPVAVSVGLAGLFAVLLATRAVDNRTAGTRGFGVAWLALPAFLSLYGLVVVGVLLGALVGWEGEWYRAEKRA